MLKDKLQIVLITYNRRKQLKETFEQIFAETSPIKDFDITILNNNSDDGTDEVIKEYQKKFPNIEHIKHHINIGGNANICRAIELALVKNKEYFWILCDDDLYNFSAWNEVEKAIEEKKDLIVVYHSLDADEIKDYKLVNELTFLPAGIYRTELITSTMIQNAYMNIYHSFPHVAIICSFFNNNITNFEIIKDRIVIQNWYRTARDFHKGISKAELHYKQKYINMWVSYINIYKMLNDKKFRYKCNESLWIDKSFFYGCWAIWRHRPSYLPNYIDAFLVLSFTQKILFLAAPLVAPLYYRIKYYCKCLYIFAKTDILK